MRVRQVLGVVVVAIVFIASSAEAQRHRRPPPTPPPAEPQTTPPAAPQTAPAGAPDSASRDQEARMLFEAGRVAYAAGRFADALGYFTRAYEMSGRAVLLYNVGSAADKLRRDAVALDAFRRYLDAMPNAENRPEVESRIRVLEEVVAADQARTTPTVTQPPPPDATAAAAIDATSGDQTQREGELDASLHVGGTGNDHPRDEGGSIFGEWWFWTIVGVVVVGGAVGIGVAASGGGGLGPLLPGDDGHVYMTLGMP